MKTSITLLAALIILYPSAFILAQGSLTPPGAPAPTMKTLDQLEARTPISSAPFVINASGSYYLTGNLAVGTGNAITISTDQVTLDLNGFSITSTASPASGTGVLINGLRRNVTVRNGHVRGTTTFAAGVFTTGGFLNGVNNATSGSANLRIADVNVSGVGDDGIVTILSNPSSRNIIERCSVSICAGLGIRTGTVIDCNADTIGTLAIAANIVSNSYGESVGAAAANHGISGFFSVANCYGVAAAGNGIQGGAQVSNSHGASTSGTGLVGDAVNNCQGISNSNTGLFAGNASNSIGTSTSSTGLLAVLATNCQGTSTSGGVGLSTTIASFCRGRRDGGTAITAVNAIGCAVLGTGTVSATKFLGTP